MRGDERYGKRKEVNTLDLIGQRVRVKLRITILRFKGVQEEIPWEEASTLQIVSVAFLPGQCTSPQLQDNVPVHNSIHNYLTKMDIKTVPHPPYSPGLAPCDF